MSASERWDCVVIGAGAAGLMAAIQLGRQKKRVLLLDSQSQIGAKILMSGGTRCNVTNTHITPKDYATESPNIVRNILRGFPSDATIQFFRDIGVELIEEKKGQCYPATQKAQTILNALIQAANQAGVRLTTDSKVESLQKQEDIYHIQSSSGDYTTATVILATGGLSYPNTGSDGGGYRLAREFGHSLVFTTPALTPLRMQRNIWTRLMGLAVEARLTLWVDHKKHLEKDTSLLFTHFGLSGLGVLDVSRHWHRLQNKHTVKLTAAFLPDAKTIFQEYAKHYPNKTVKTFLQKHFPNRFGDAVLAFLNIPQATAVVELTKPKRKALAQFLTAYELPVTDVFGYGKAEVTAGGIPFREVVSKTLESKLMSGLFFCGEILDVDGRIGGFNFQWAWASGFAAARGVDTSL